MSCILETNTFNSFIDVSLRTIVKQSPNSVKLADPFRSRPHVLLYPHENNLGSSSVALSQIIFSD